MAVSATTRKQSFTLDGSTAAFTFTFRAIPANLSDIKCVATVSGSDTTLTYTTQYTVAINANGIGGTVTLVSPSAIGSGTLTVYRDTTNLQSSDYDNFNQFPADTLETDLDIRTMVAQESVESIARVLTLPISYSGTASTTLPTPVANGILGWNAAGSALELKTITPASSFTLATQSQATTGTENTTYMSPLRVFQAVAAYLLACTGAINFFKGADIASASTTNIGAATGSVVDVTGTVTITALGTIQAGTTRTVRFTGILILTHNASSLILPTGANITTQAGDVVEFVSLGSGNWYCSKYQRKDGTALASSAATVATQAEMESATTTGSTVTPARVQYHPGVAKAWGSFNGTGTPAYTVNYNMDSSITDNGTGDWTVSITTDFSSGNYCLVGACKNTAAGNGDFFAIKEGTTPAAGSVNLIVGHGMFTKADSDIVNFAIFGDQ